MSRLLSSNYGKEHPGCRLVITRYNIQPVGASDKQNFLPIMRSFIHLIRLLMEPVGSCSSLVLKLSFLRDQQFFFLPLRPTKMNLFKLL